MPQTGTMHRLEARTVRLLGSTQVATSVVAVVKELLENSLDAGADSVEIKLEGGGLKRIEVRDNGRGIPLEHVGQAGLRHYTSKLRGMDDLDELATYGFRGEGLNSVCAVGEVSLTTKTDDDAVATTYVLDANGAVASTQPSAGETGTTVVVTGLFAKLPVRRKGLEGSKAQGKQWKALVDMLGAYRLARPHVRWVLRDGTNALTQQRAATLKDAVGQLYGSQAGASMQPLHLQAGPMHVGGYVPARGEGTRTHKVVLVVNGRPVSVKGLAAAVIGVVEACCPGGTRYGVIFVSITLPPSSYDVNVDAAKSMVLLHEPGLVEVAVTQAVSDAYGGPPPPKEPPAKRSRPNTPTPTAPTLSAQTPAATHPPKQAAPPPRAPGKENEPSATTRAAPSPILQQHIRLLEARQAKGSMAPAGRSMAPAGGPIAAPPPAQAPSGPPPHRPSLAPISPAPTSAPVLPPARRPVPAPHPPSPLSLQPPSRPPDRPIYTVPIARKDPPCRLQLKSKAPQVKPLPRPQDPPRPIVVAPKAREGPVGAEGVEGATATVRFSFARIKNRWQQPRAQQDDSGRQRVVGAAGSGLWVVLAGGMLHVAGQRRLEETVALQRLTTSRVLPAAPLPAPIPLGPGTLGCHDGLLQQLLPGPSHWADPASHPLLVSGFDIRAYSRGPGQAAVVELVGVCGAMKGIGPEDLLELLELLAGHNMQPPWPRPKKIEQYLRHQAERLSESGQPLSRADVSHLLAHCPPMQAPTCPHGHAVLMPIGPLPKIAPTRRPAAMGGTRLSQGSPAPIYN